MTYLSRKSHSSGFTIVELLIVIVVIGILAALVIISYNGVQTAARDKVVISDAEGVAAEVTRYSTKHNGTFGGVLGWYSAGTPNPNIAFTPSPGNVIDVVATSTEYCVRVFNPAATNNSITNAYKKGYNSTSCDNIPPSVAAGGTWENTDVAESVYIAPPIAQWKLNGNASDSIGIANGTVSGATLTAGQNGQANKAYRFDGVNDYIEMPPVLTNYSKFTISVWARVMGGAAANSGIGYIIHEGPAQYQGTSAFWIASGSTNKYEGDVSGFSSEVNRTTSVTSNTTTWHFITMTYDGTTRSIYVDGNLEISYPRGFTNSTAGNRLTIGSAAASPTYRPAQGDIDDVRIYDYVLSDQQITALYALGAD